MDAQQAIYRFTYGEEEGHVTTSSCNRCHSHRHRGRHCRIEEKKPMTVKGLST